MRRDPRNAERRRSANAISQAGCCAVALAALLATGCNDQLPGKPDPANRPVLPAERTDFSYLFARNCSGCHGADGTLGPAPPLNDPLFAAIVPDDVLVDVITNGRPGTPMPAFALEQSGTLTAEQIKILADGVKQHWKTQDAPKVDPPKYAGAELKQPSSEQVERGQKLFAQACAACHGKNGQGAEEGKPPGAVNDPALLTLLSNQVLRRIIITGRPDLGMPDFAGDAGRKEHQPLSSDQIDDLVALLAHWRSQPPQYAAAVPK